jgi:intron-binding protein aquarius
VSVFQYMRLLEYPAHKISILSTYNGQKHLIRDVIERRCANHPLFGRPSKVIHIEEDKDIECLSTHYFPSFLPACLPAF